jgi:hypothetical protein
MAFVQPTSDDLVEQFPEFTGRDDAAEFAIQLASRQVDGSWTEGDRAYAILLLAAHLMQAGAQASAGKEIASESIGPFSVSYFQSDKSFIGSTGYGEQFLALARRNVGGPVVI